jgi:hypothetical protein
MENGPTLGPEAPCAQSGRCPILARMCLWLPLALGEGKHIDCMGMDFDFQQTTGAQRPYRPVNVAFAKVWKCRSNPTSAAEAASFLASGSLSTSTANTVIW